MKPLDITNKKYGKLTAICWTRKKNSGSNYIWKFVCECGGEVEAAASEVNKGGVTRCRHCSDAVATARILVQAQKNKKSLGEAASNSAYSGYKGNAKRRGHLFSLTKTEFLTLIGLPCIYCGANKTNVAKSRNNSGDFYYTGIDRVDNSKGYVLENCVPCCHECNWAKKDKTTREFISWISRIVKNLADLK